MLAHSAGKFKDTVGFSRVDVALATFEERGVGLILVGVNDAVCKIIEEYGVGDLGRGPGRTNRQKKNDGRQQLEMSWDTTQTRRRTRMMPPRCQGRRGFSGRRKLFHKLVLLFLRFTRTAHGNGA